MLYEILRYLRNFFPGYRWHVEGFKIEDGVFDFPELREGQYFLIEDSRYNDGLHQYGDALIDEEFSGWVTELRIPKEVIELASEIEQWSDKYKDAVASPYQSESFGGYSYTKGGNGSGNNSYCGWQSAFASRLKVWRKV